MSGQEKAPLGVAALSGRVWGAGWLSDGPGPPSWPAGNKGVFLCAWINPLLISLHSYTFCLIFHGTRHFPMRSNSVHSPSIERPEGSFQCWFILRHSVSPLRFNISHTGLPLTSGILVVFYKSSLEDMFIDFRDRAGERERQIETSIGCLLSVPCPGIEPVTFGCTGTMLQPAKPPGQGSGILVLMKHCPVRHLGERAQGHPPSPQGTPVSTADQKWEPSM